jgi:hypothetical protein
VSIIRYFFFFLSVGIGILKYLRIELEKTYETISEDLKELHRCVIESDKEGIAKFSLSCGKKVSQTADLKARLKLLELQNMPTLQNNRM